MNLMDAWHVPTQVRDVYVRVRALYEAIEHKLYFETPVVDGGKIRLIQSFPNCEDQAEIFASVFPELHARIILIGSVAPRIEEFQHMTLEEFRVKWGMKMKEHAWCRIYGIASFAIDLRPIGIVSGPALQSLDFFNYKYIELDYSVVRYGAHEKRLEMWKRIAKREALRLKLV